MGWMKIEKALGELPATAEAANKQRIYPFPVTIFWQLDQAWMERRIRSKQMSLYRIAL